MIFPAFLNMGIRNVIYYSAFSLYETADSAQYEQKVAQTVWNGRLVTHILL